MAPNPKPWRRLWFVLAPLLFICIGLAGALVFVSRSAEASANLADQLRSVIGDQPVAVMEDVLFKTQDILDQIEYRLGLRKPENPFGDLQPPSAVAVVTPAPSLTFTPSPKPATPTTTNTPLKPETQTVTPPQTATLAPTSTPQPPTATFTPTPWAPPSAKAMGNMEGEGLWVPLFTSPSGQVVAYRTFIQPDPNRPYVLVAAVAFDLQATRLNYVIGFEEPYHTHITQRLGGIIPKQDKVPGVLLAAFNGGFKYQHSRSGSMANGFESAPPVDGYGTVVIFKDGSVKIGEWGRDFDQNTPNITAYRQNGPLAIDDGMPSEKVADPQYWGYTLSGGTVTWRSGMAISKDERILYYFAGPSLDITSLTTMMMAVSPKAAIQLDINNYWVYMCTFKEVKGELESVPLLPKDWTENTYRFLRPYPRDFFYLAMKASQ